MWEYEMQGEILLNQLFTFAKFQTSLRSYNKNAKETWRYRVWKIFLMINFLQLLLCTSKGDPAYP